MNLIFRHKNTKVNNTTSQNEKTKHQSGENGLVINLLELAPVLLTLSCSCQDKMF